MSRKFSIAIVLLFVITPLLAKSHTPKKNTRAAVKAFAQQGASFVAKNGPDCEALKGPDWSKGDYYIFVSNSDGTLVCHPTIAGKNNADIVDANGKHLATDLEVASKKKGGGWVDYVWPRPGTTNPIPKSSYATQVKAPDGKWYMVGSGGYQLK